MMFLLRSATFSRMLKGRSRAIIGDLVAEGLGLDVTCGRCHRTLYLEPLEACLLLGEQTPWESAKRRLMCSTCGATGKNGEVTMRFSIRDYYARLQAAGCWGTKPNR